MANKTEKSDKSEKADKAKAAAKKAAPAKAVAKGKDAKEAKEAKEVKEAKPAKAAAKKAPAKAPAKKAAKTPSKKAAPAPAPEVDVVDADVIDQATPADRGPADGGPARERFVGESGLGESAIEAADLAAGLESSAIDGEDGDDGDDGEEAAEPARELTPEERELSAIYGEELAPAAPGAAHAEFSDRLTADEDRPMTPEINGRQERQKRWEERRDQRRARRDFDRARRAERSSSRGGGAGGGAGVGEGARREERRPEHAGGERRPEPGARRPEGERRPDDRGERRPDDRGERRPDDRGERRPEQAERRPEAERVEERPRFDDRPRRDDRPAPAQLPLPAPIAATPIPADATGIVRAGNAMGDAAWQVFAGLRGGQPMPVKQLGSMMRKRGLFEQDPEQAWPELKAALLADERSYRALGLRPRIVYRGRDLFAPGPVASSATAEAEADLARALSAMAVATHATLKARIGKANQAGFERLVHAYLYAVGYQDIAWIKRTDAISYATAIAPGSAGTIMISARSGDEPVDRRGVGELRVGVEAKQLLAGHLFAARELSSEAERELERPGRSIAVYAGDSFVTALLSAGVGVVTAAAPVRYVDDQLFGELLAG